MSTKTLAELLENNKGPYAAMAVLISTTAAVLQLPADQIARRPPRHSTSPSTSGSTACSPTSAADDGARTPAACGDSRPVRRKIATGCTG